MSEDTWYYSQAGAQMGPVSLAELRHLLSTFQIGSGDLVWKQGLASWMPIGSVPELGAVAPPAMPPPIAAPNASGSGAGAALLQRGQDLFRNFAEHARSLPESGDTLAVRLPHVRLMTQFLAFLKSVLSTSGLDQIDRIAKRVGHLAYVAAALLFILFYTVLAIKADTIKLLFYALLVIVPLLLMGHFTAVKFLESGSRLLSKLPSRLFSWAFLDCTALVLTCCSLGSLLGGTFLLIQESSWPAFGAGIVFSAVSAYLSGLALNPASLNIEVDENEAAEEEALGILTFWLKLILRLAPVLFGVGSVVGAGAAIYFLIQLFRDEIFSITFPVFGDHTIMDITVDFLALGFVPLLAYLVFVLLHLLLNTLRAILEVPQRLEALRQDR